jgi:ornithine carbamoyltransferase
MKTTKEQQLLLNIYRAIYFDIGVNFDEINKSKQDWFLDYCLPESRQEEILEDILNGKRLTKLKKNAIKMNYYLGVSPKSC